MATLPPPLAIRHATAADRDRIYQVRHDVYARELHQHPENPAARLSDPLDGFNHYIVAARGGDVVGFVSITPPGRTYSVDKYLPRESLARELAFDHRLYEIRILTVVPAHRHTPAAALLMHAAVRWIDARGGRTVVAIGRSDLVPLYQRVGMRPLGRTIRSGALTFELMAGGMADLRAVAAAHPRWLRKLAAACEWRIDAPFLPAAACDHGGAFFDAIGDDFADLSRRHRIINADVLDAWFPPAPGVIAALRDDPGWLLRTSPPTRCEGLIRAIARARGIPRECIVPGAGSSDLIFRAFTRWLTPRSRALLLDPTYGEYAHVLEHVVGCRVDRLALDPAAGYTLDPDQLSRALARGYDLAVIVNPNNPTGGHVPRPVLGPVLAAAPPETRIWIDEAYVEYAGAGQTLEQFAAASTNTVICKSLSKVYALSGARAAYLCGPPGIAAGLLPVTPPWAISLPAQVAAVRALEDPAYYAARHAETHALRAELAAALREQAGLDPLEGVINSVLCPLPAGAPDPADVVAACRLRGVYIRDCASISAVLARTIRIAVRDAEPNGAVVGAVAAALRRAGSGRAAAAPLACASGSVNTPG